MHRNASCSQTEYVERSGDGDHLLESIIIQITFLKVRSLINVNCNRF